MEESIIFGISHIIGKNISKDQCSLETASLSLTVDCILKNYSSRKIKILVATQSNRNVCDKLPEYQKKYISTIIRDNIDPMYIGFSIHEEFAKVMSQYNWFVFLEDDILVHDSFAIEKTKIFTSSHPINNLFQPNRYEMWQDMKVYIDSGGIDWTNLHINNGIEIGCFRNPHSAYFCLSKEQMKYWIERGGGRQYYDGLSNPLESAATFELGKVFTFFKPKNPLYYFEVQHNDIKYAWQESHNFGNNIYKSCPSLP